ncbi:MAG: hypothetical protein K2I20_02400 [Clostridia bacterium]|nr:hypothetical protein [Clostridia bacterium]MDE6355933.1 hypothetical protein [Clostridia bacterium]
MPFEYIIAIVCGSVFAVLFIANIIVYYLNAKKKKLAREELEKMYADKNLAKMKYDSVAYDKETEELIKNAEASNEIKPVASAEEEKYNQLVIEGLEEITGDYKPEN